MRPLLFLSVLLIALVCACDEPAKPAPTAAPEPAAEAEKQAPEAPVLSAPKDPNDACAQIIAVAYLGAVDAPQGITRDASAARARAEELRANVAAGADFRELATSASDAASKVRGGAIGTFTRDQWPEKHAALADTVFALKVHEVSTVVEAPYGATLVRRCPVERVHTRHILIRYSGAKNAGDDIERSRDEARTLATRVQNEAVAGAKPFEALARQYSEDSSAERGGDMGSVGRGLFVPPYEEAAFALTPGAISGPVETVYGFHVIQRVD